MGLDVISYVLAKNFAKKYTDEQISKMGKGMTYKGNVPTEDDLPLTDNKIGYVYTTADNGREYIWTKDAASGEKSDWQGLGNGEIEIIRLG